MLGELLEGKLKTPRRFIPSVRVGAMRPISSGGTAVARRTFQRLRIDCHRQSDLRVDRAV